MKRHRKRERKTSTSGFTRRDFLKGTGLMLTSLFAGQALSRASRAFAAPSIPKKIAIGTFGPSHCAVPFVYAKLNSFFKDEELTIDLVNYPNMPSIAQDLIGGKIAFGQLVVPLAFAMHTGAKPFSGATPIVIPQITGTNGAALMFREDAEIRTPLDFKGKVIANHSKLAVHFLINMMLLEKHGLDRDKDLEVKIVELGEIADAVKQGRVDAFIMPEPKNAAIEKMGTAKVYMLSRYLWPNHPCCCLVTRRDTFERDRELVSSVTRAITRAALSANDPDTREETIDLLRGSREYNYNKVAKEVLMRAFIPGRADFYPFPYQSAAVLIIEEMKKHNLLDGRIDAKQTAEQVFLSDLSRSIMKELGSAPPESNYRSERILGEIREYTD